MNQTAHEIRKEEDYLFSIARKTLDYFGIEYKPDELSSLVMMELINIKK